MHLTGWNEGNHKKAGGYSLVGVPNVERCNG